MRDGVTLQRRLSLVGRKPRISPVSGHLIQVFIVVINRPVAQTPQCTSPISHDALLCYKNVHVSATRWCIMGYLSDALWDLQDGSI